MWKTRIIAVLFIALGIVLGLSVYKSERDQTNTFKLGLDLRGGSYLVYRADTSDVLDAEISDSMDSLRDVIERRINAFGVAEPNVQTEAQSVGGETENRLVIELPGVTDLDEAVEMIGETPFLEFRTERSVEEIALIQAEYEKLQQNAENPEGEQLELDEELLNQDIYIATELTGKYLQKSSMQFQQGGVAHGGSLNASPYITLSFNDEGAGIFEQITRDNVGKTIAIYLDGLLVSAPNVNTAISGGQAIIEGNFTIDEAKTIVGRLNSGALPTPIELISTNTIGPTLGQEAVDAGVQAGVIGLILVALVLVLWYRLPGLIAVVALGVYTAIMLWMFKFIPVTLTSAGIAGFIISIGIAVDANILIFERIKEEIKDGKNLYTATDTGFKRAWASIRDANISSIISAVILFATGIAVVQGFALTFGLGIIISMFTAITVTRSILVGFTSKKVKKPSKIMKFLYQSGLKK